MEYHRDQIELGVRPYVSRFVDEYPKVRQGIAPRYRNGGEYPRRRVDQDLFDQSVAEHYKACELLRQQAIPPTRNRDLSWLYAGVDHVPGDDLSNRPHARR